MTPPARLSYWMRANRLCLLATNHPIANTKQIPPPPTLLTCRGPGFLKSVKLASSPPSEEPTAETMFNIVEDAYTNDSRKTGVALGAMGQNDEGVMFSGFADSLPRSRLDVICDAASQIKQARHGVPLMLLTTGVGGDDNACHDLLESGIEQVLLFVPSTQSPNQYAFHGEVCSFASQVVEQGLTLRGVTVSMDKFTKPHEKEVRDLLMALGAVDVTVKPFIPA